MNLNLRPTDFNNIKFKDDADTISEEINKSINRYNMNLDESHEVGIMLASFGQSITVNITEVGHQGAKLIKFKGFLPDNDTPVELYQHVNQLSFLLVSLPRVNQEEPKKHIGFIQE